MKKFICMLLVVVMMLSLIACGGKTEPVATTPTVDTTVTEPVGEEAPQTPSVDASEPSEPQSETLPPTEVLVSVEELLQNENTVVINDLSPEECWTILTDLGYTELYAYEIRDIPSYPEDYILNTLTYNESAFRLDFTAVDTYLQKQYEGFSLYGTKTNHVANISGVDFGNYEIVEYDNYINRFDIPDDIKTLLGDETPFETNMVEYSRLISSDLANDENGNMTGSAELENIFYLEFFYPHTGNMYNLLQTCNIKYDAANFTDATFNVETGYWPNLPNNLLMTEWREVLGKVWVSNGAVEGVTAHSVLPDSSFVIYYEEWMHMDEWAASKYNIDGWVWYEFYKNQWCLMSQDEKWYIIELYVPDENGEYVRCTMKDYADGNVFWMADEEDMAKHIAKIEASMNK